MAIEQIFGAPYVAVETNTGDSSSRYKLTFSIIVYVIPDDPTKYKQRIIAKVDTDGLFAAKYVELRRFSSASFLWRGSLLLPITSNQSLPKLSVIFFAHGCLTASDHNCWVNVGKVIPTRKSTVSKRVFFSVLRTYWL